MTAVNYVNITFLFFTLPYSEMFPDEFVENGLKGWYKVFFLLGKVSYLEVYTCLNEFIARHNTYSAAIEAKLTEIFYLYALGEGLTF